MNLSRLEIVMLRLIHREYPIAHNSSIGEIVATNERPLLTEEAISDKLKKLTAEEVRIAIQRLLSFQCIAKVYLFSRGEFVEQWAGGKTIRRLPMVERAGKDCFQVTDIGERILDGCFRERAKRLVGIWFSKVVEEYMPLLIAFLIGMLISSVFGFDIRQLRK